MPSTARDASEPAALHCAVPKRLDRRGTGWHNKRRAEIDQVNTVARLQLLEALAEVITEGAVASGEAGVAVNAGEDDLLILNRATDPSRISRARRVQSGRALHPPPVGVGGVGQDEL
eukprot:7386642-Prymnesium_polylepis.4